MAIEIERRFLVDDPRAPLAAPGVISSHELRQGYLGLVNGLRLRVRIITDANGNRSAVLTLKTRRRGICRHEFEQSLQLDQAEQLLASLPSSRIICKTRYCIRCRDGLHWSLDCFGGANAGLAIAEIELIHQQQQFELPDWIGEEITFDRRYGNSTLARSPIGGLLRRLPECDERLISASISVAGRPARIGPFAWQARNAEAAPA